MEAGAALMSMELLSLLLMTMLAERIFYYIFKNDYGHPYVLYVLSIAIGFCHFVGMIAWFAQTGANWTNDCDAMPIDDDEEIKFCAGRGPILMIVNFLLLVIFIGLFWWCFYRRDMDYDSGKRGIESGKLCCLGTRLWLILVFILLIGNVAFIVGGWSTEKWVKREGDTLDFIGSLYRCESCEGTWIVNATAPSDVIETVEINLNP
jgi:H+/Cl- antiporter ClcA